MATSGPSRLPQCHHQLITSTSDRIRETAQPGGPTPPHQKFFPTQSLKDIFTPELVQQILNHGAEWNKRCTECEAHLKERPEVKPSANYVERILRTDSSLNLFALLVFLGYPLFIGCFLSTYAEGAIPSPRFFSQYDLSDRSFRHLPAKQMQILISEFEDAKWRFSVPDFDHEWTFQIYPESTIMPYLSQEIIDEGAFGTVYKVNIHPGYCSNKFLKSANRGSRGSSRSEEIIFARKEFKNKEVVDFLKERTALELIDKLKHPHLIHIKQTYQLGERFNILFPHAKANLQNYLRKEKAPRRRQISRNPMWEQVLGITEALSKIINFQDPVDNRGLKGHHLDLKPQNVLVFIERAPGRPSKEVFRISDFGQSEFIEVGSGHSGTTSSLIGANGTDAYAPPEYYGIGASPVYDVWSLGIIVLEILTFAIRGIDGLVHRSTGLDNVRQTKGSGYHNSRFYSGQGRNALVKREILTWLDGLLKYRDLQDVERDQFVRPLVKLILEMLEPDYKRRKTINEVLLRMQAIFKAGISDPSEETALSLKKNDENILVDLKAVRLFPEGLSNHSEQTYFFILENKAASLRIFTKNHIRHARHQRQELRVVPLFQYTDEVKHNHFPFVFESAIDTAAISLTDMAIVVDDEKHSRHLQAALINHEVSKRFRVTGVTIKTGVPVMKKIKTSFSKLVAKPSTPFSKSGGTNSNSLPEAELDPKPLWIELWVEKRKETSTLEESSTGSIGLRKLPRLNREANPEKSIPLGRVVIYCEDRILIIPFARESAIANRDVHNKSDSLTFQPMDVKQSEPFRVSCLKGHQTDAPPGIPMSFETLTKVEEKNAFLCKLLKVKFANHADASIFYRLFRRQKSRWQSLIRGDSTKIPGLYTSEAYDESIVHQAKESDPVSHKDASAKLIVPTHAVDIGDVQSLKSITTFHDSGIGSSSQSVLSGSSSTTITKTALNQILLILLSDTKLQAMFVEAARKVDKEKYIRNIRRLVHLYYLDLRRAAVDSSQKKSANILGQHSLRCAHELYDLVHPQEVPSTQSFASNLPQQIEKIQLLEEYIRSTAQQPPEPISQQPPELTPEPERDSIDDSQSVESDTSDVEDSKFPNFEHVKNFLVGGAAYSQLKLNLNGFINPQETGKIPDEELPRSFEDETYPKTLTLASRPELDLGLQTLQIDQDLPLQSQVFNHDPAADALEKFQGINTHESHQYPYSGESDTETMDSSSVEDPKSTFGKMRNKALQRDVHSPPASLEQSSRTVMGGLRVYYESLTALKMEIYEKSVFSTLTRTSKTFDKGHGFIFDLTTFLTDEDREKLIDLGILPKIDSLTQSLAFTELFDQGLIPQSSLELVHDLFRVVECRDMLCVVCANLTRLQESDFIKTDITIPMVDTRRSNVVNHKTVVVADVFDIARYFTYEIESVNVVRSDNPIIRGEQIRTMLKYAMQKCERFLLALGFPSRTEDDGIISCYTLAGFLDLAVLVHVNAQIEDIEAGPANRNTTIEIPKAMVPHLPLRIKLQHFRTRCLDQFLNHQEVWVFHTDNCPVDPPLYMSMSIGEFADIWGPVWEIKDSRNNTVQYDTGNGYIMPWGYDPAIHPELSHQEQLSHWIAKETAWTAPGPSLDDSDTRTAPALDVSPPTFTNKEKLLIGAPTRGRRHMKWSSCKCDIPTIEAKLLGSGRLSPLGANDSYSYVDARAISLVGGKYLSAGANITIKRENGVLSKEFFINSWEKQPEFRDLRDFSKLWGVAVSLCTMNAERVSLFELLCTPTVKRYLKRVQWETPELELALLKTLGEEGSLEALHRLWNQGRNKELGEVLFGCLQALSLTGYDEKRDEFSAFWISPDSTLPQRVILEPGEHSWTKFLKDSKNSFAVAVMVEDCLGARFAKRRCGAVAGGSVLQTSICVNEQIDPSKKLLKIPLTVAEAESQKWAWEWDVSNLSKGICFPVRSEGRLKTIKKLDTRQLLLEWDLVWREVIKGYAGIQRGKANVHWEYTGHIEGRGQPIPVFLLSPDS